MDQEIMAMIAHVARRNGELLERGLFTRAEFNEAMLDLADIVMDLIVNEPLPPRNTASNVLLFVRPPCHPKGN